MKVPLLDLVAQFKTIEEEVLKAVESVFRRQQFVLGPEVSELERQVARLSDSAYGIGVASGSDALLLALMALNIGPNYLAVHIFCNGRFDRQTPCHTGLR